MRGRGFRCRISWHRGLRSGGLLCDVSEGGGGGGDGGTNRLRRLGVRGRTRSCRRRCRRLLSRGLRGYYV